MAITDKTRKLLWGRSGSRCALCRQPLVVTRGESGTDTLIGEECHIVGRSPIGPRAAPETTVDPDQVDNLILLCSNHHKLVDDRPEEYTVERLHTMKRDHDAWVAAALDDSHRPKIRFFRQRGETDVMLRLVATGERLLGVTAGCCQSILDNDDVTTADEAELIGEFLQDVHDWNEILSDIGPAERVRAEYKLTQTIVDLAVAGFLVYAARLERTVSVGSDSSPWPVAVVRVVRMGESGSEPSADPNGVRDSDAGSAGV